MNRAEFEADALHKGYEIREGKIEPNVHREPHVHDWDARLIVLEGALDAGPRQWSRNVPCWRLMQPGGKHAARGAHRGRWRSVCGSPPGCGAGYHSVRLRR
jgi:hypothetical protein